MQNGSIHWNSDEPMTKIPVINATIVPYKTKIVLQTLTPDIKYKVWNKYTYKKDYNSLDNHE